MSHIMSHGLSAATQNSGDSPRKNEENHMKIEFVPF
jgi:hypothetical protein